MRQANTNEKITDNSKSLKNKLMIPLLLLSLALIFSFGVSAVSAVVTDTSSGSSVIYVNNATGDDSYDGLSPTWNGTSGPKLSIKNATGTVNTNGTVNIANGLYTGENNTNILVDKNVAFIGQSQTGTIIDAKNLAQIFTIQPGVNVSMLYLTLANGNTTSSGGAILNNGNLTLVNCTFTGNTAPSTANNMGNGGAIFSTGNLTVISSNFSGNTARWAGGAVESQGSLTVVNSTFTGNHASHGGAIHNYMGTLNVIGSNFTGNTVTFNGGAIHNQGTFNLIESNFTGNSATQGGAIYHYQDTMTVYNCNFTSNNASSSGGAGGAIYNNAASTITNSNFTTNTANGSGGAIYNPSTATIVNSTFTGNNALRFGGAICDGSLNIYNSTFTGNNAGWDGGVIYSYYGTLNITGSNFVGNTAHGLGGAIVSCTVLNLYDSTLTGNHAVGYATGTTYGWGGAIYIQRGNAQIHYNRIAGNSAVVSNALYFDTVLGGTVNATNNWWGSNDNPSSQIYGPVNYSPWLYMTLTANPTTIKNTETSLITVSFNNLFDGTTRTDLDPTVGHIPDGSPVNFQTDLGTIGCKSIDKTTTGGIATATLTATELAGVAHVNATTDNQTLFVNVTITPKAGLYLTVTPNKANPVPGDTVVYTLKVGNKGPDAAKDVVMTYVIPEGLEFAGANVDIGTYTYDPATRTITWNISDVPVGDPYMWLSLNIAHSGQYIINPTLTTSTYDPTLNSNIQSVTVNAAAQTKVKAAGRTIGMQDTGLPIAGLVLAILAVLGGLVTPRKK